MDELDVFRDFRRGVAAPSEDAQRRASARLASAIDREQAPPTSARSLIGKRRFSALALTALAGATAAALFVSTPWSESPGFLEQAQAALTPPTGTVLHYKWEATFTSTDPACTVTRAKEIWIDQTPPHAYRALLSYFDRDPGTADPRALACSSGTPAEIGGTLDSWRTLVFEPPNTLRESALLFRSPPDPVQDLRDAISVGSAHHEGRAQLGGRTVERIRMDPPPDCPVPGCETESTYAYVDPETFYPVQIESPHAYIVPPDQPVVRSHAAVRFLTFEYLPRTAANLALTDIRAQHPDATGP